MWASRRAPTRPSGGNRRGRLGTLLENPGWLTDKGPYSPSAGYRAWRSALTALQYPPKIELIFQEAWDAGVQWAQKQMQSTTGAVIDQDAQHGGGDTSQVVVPRAFLSRVLQELAEVADLPEGGQSDDLRALVAELRSYVEGLE